MTHQEILLLANKKMRVGVKKHGRFDARTDTRNLYDEAIAEHLDAINYNAMQIQKLLIAKKRWEKLDVPQKTKTKCTAKHLCDGDMCCGSDFEK